MLARRLQRVAPWLLAFLAPGLLYLPTLGYGFVFDDVPLVVKNPALADPSRALSYFARDIDALRLDLDQARSNYYRPLLMLVLLVVKRAGGDDPRAWHAAVAALHALAGLLAMALLVGRGFSRRNALFGSLAFSAHPAHVDSAAWVSGIQDVWLGVTGLCAALAWQAWRKQPSTPRLALVALAYGAALLSKEAALGLFLFAAGETAWTHRNRGSSGVRPGVAFGGLAVVAGLTLAYFALRLHVLGTLARSLPSSAPLVLALASIPRVVAEYVRLLLFPHDLALLSPVRPVASVASVEALAGAAVLAGSLGAAAWLVGRRPQAFTPCLWFAAWLLPCLNLWALNPEWVVMDRYLYLPSLALPWLVLTLLQKGDVGPPPTLDSGGRRDHRRSSTAVLAGLTIVYAGLSLAHMRDFRDERSFWARMLESDPRSSTAWAEHGRLLLEAGRRAEARAALERAASLDPDAMLPPFRLANLDLAEGRAEQAVRSYRRLIERSPGYVPPWRNLPVALEKAGRADEALSVAFEAAARFPRDADAALNLATLLRARGRREDALTVLRQARGSAPRDARLALREALLLAETGREEEALASALAARELSGDATYQAQLGALAAELRERLGNR